MLLAAFQATATLPSVRALLLMPIPEETEPRTRDATGAGGEAALVGNCIQVATPLDPWPVPWRHAMIARALVEEVPASKLPHTSGRGSTPPVVIRRRILERAPARVTVRQLMP